MSNNEIDVQTEQIQDLLQDHALKAEDIPTHRIHLLTTTRHDVVTAQKVDVGIIFQAMLSAGEAQDYMLNNGVPQHVALRVLAQPQRRRGHPVDGGVRADSPASGTESTDILDRRTRTSAGPQAHPADLSPHGYTPSASLIEN